MADVARAAIKNTALSKRPAFFKLLWYIENPPQCRSGLNDSRLFRLWVSVVTLLRSGNGWGIVCSDYLALEVSLREFHVNVGPCA